MAPPGLSGSRWGPGVSAWPERRAVVLPRGRGNVAFARFSLSDGTSIQVRTTCAGAGGRFYAFALSPGGKEKPVRWTPTALEEPRGCPAPR